VNRSGGTLELLAGGQGGAPRRALVIGYGLSGRACARWLAVKGWQVVVLEDDPVVGSAASGAGLPPGASVEVAPGPARSAELASQADLVVPSPGVPVCHPSLVAALDRGAPVLSEVELAWAELVARRAGATAAPASPASSVAAGAYPLVAVTGTNGKTTVTQLVTAMLSASGLNAVAAGNIGYPLVEAVGNLGAPAGQGVAGQGVAGPRPGTVVVAEVSSFQLEYTRDFRPDVSCWLNFAPDHLDWHPSLAHYARAKARIWANQGAGSTIVVNAQDPVVTEALAAAPAGARVVTFGTAGTGTAAPLAPAEPAWLARPEGVEGPGGFSLKAGELRRAFPHDLANIAAAAAVAVAAGATTHGCLAGARAAVVPPHRVELVGERGGVAWYDDSKATTPASVRAAVLGFTSVVLIAGGHNKGLDLSDLVMTVPPVRSVVAIGESAAEVAKAFAGTVPVREARSMPEAVALASRLARPGDAVLLSPGCASFDWYSSYVERGEHFTALVRRALEEVGTP